MQFLKTLTYSSGLVLLIGLTACSESVVTDKPDSAGGNSETMASPASVDSSGDSGADAAVSDETCAHGAPKDLCFICDPSLREQGRLWCREHGRYEDRCWKCHPELRDEERLYCQEHFLYEDECFLCHPELKPKGNGEAGNGLASSTANGKRDPAPDGGLMCREHEMPESECGICHPELASKTRVGQDLKIRFNSDEAASKAGVRTEHPRTADVIDSVTCYAEVVFNQNKLAHITPLVSGMVRSVEVDLGSQVEPGDLVASISSIGIADAQSRFLKALAEMELAKKTFDRETRLHSRGITAAKELQESKAAYDSAAAGAEAARQRLQTLGFSDRQIRKLASEKKGSGLLELRAPFAGEIVQRTAVQGATVEKGDSLFKLADRSDVWAILKIPESQLGRVEKGQRVRLNVEAYPDVGFTGKLTWISAEIDHKTRMAKARAEIPNPDGRLKANMFANARIDIGVPTQATMVPATAIQFLANRPFAFVRMAADLYSAKPVFLGPREGDTCAVLEGLDPADQVVTQGSFAVKSQFLISRLGAGCVNE